MTLVRAATTDDIPRLLELEYRLFDNSMNETMLARELAHGEGFVLESGGRVDGYALVRPAGEKLDLTRLGVDPAVQGAGIGQALLRKVIDMGKPVVLTVKKKNYGALRLYRRYDFVIVGQLNEAEAWVMRRDVSGVDAPDERSAG
jgi:ribosomal-protein-alanine N-acetyltransferase